MISYLVAAELGWLYRDQETSDMGIDAHFEVVSDAGHASGRLLAVQIKSGLSYFKTEGPGGWWFPCNAAHVDYWKNCSLPVVIALFHPETRRVYWQHVNDETLVGTGKNWKVLVPSSQQLAQECAAALGAPARRQPDPGSFHEALDRLPADPRGTLLRAHADGASYAVPLADLLANADDPAAAVNELLALSPRWLADVTGAERAGVWLTVAGYAAAHELGLDAVDALERAAEAAGDLRSASRLRALAAILAVGCDPERARALIAVSASDTPVLAAVATAMLSVPQGKQVSELPEVIARALETSDEAAVGESTVMRFVAHTYFAMDRYDEGMTALEQAVQLAPDYPGLLVELAKALIWHTAAGTPTLAYLDTHRALRLALTARAQYRRWRGPSGEAALILLRIRLETDNVGSALATAIAAPMGEAQGIEVDYQPLLVDASRAAYLAGQTSVADSFAARLTDAGARAQMVAMAVDTDPEAGVGGRVAAWQEALEAASDDDQRGLAASALTGLGVWPVAALDSLHEQGLVSDALYQVRWACAEDAAGDRAAAVRRLRQWEGDSILAAAALVMLHDDDLAAAADIAERAGNRFGDLALRVHAVQLWEESDQPDRARLRALTLLSRPHLPVGMRRDLRGRAVQWAYDRQDWVDMEDHALAGLAEESAEDEAAAGARLRPVSGVAAMFAWAAVRAQVSSRRLAAAWNTVTRFSLACGSADEARMWLTLVDWAGWTLAHAESALEIAERFPALSYDIGSAILRVTSGSAPDESELADTATSRPPLTLTAPLHVRLTSLLAQLPPGSPAIEMPANTTDLIRFVQDTLGPSQSALDTIADAVRIGVAPMGLLARAASRPCGLAFAQRAAGVVPAASREPQHFAAEARAALTALNGPVIIDLSAVAVATTIPGRFGEMRAVFSATATSTAVHDDLVNTCYAIESLQRSSGQLGVQGGAVTLTTLSQEDKRHLAERGTAFSRVISTLTTHPVTDMGPLQARLHFETSPDVTDTPWLHAAQLALDTGSALWCDDAALRRLLEPSGIPTFGSWALLHVLTRHDDYPQFTDQRFNDDLKTLMRAYVVDLPLDQNDLMDAAKSENWNPGYASAPFDRPSFWGADDSEDLWSAVIASVWENAPDQLSSWYAIAARGCSALTVPQDVAVLLASFTALSLLAVGLGPEPVEALWPTALNALEGYHRASVRRWEAVGAVQSPLAVPSTGSFRDLVREQLIGRLQEQLGFSSALSASMVDVAMPPTDPDR